MLSRTTARDEARPNTWYHGKDTPPRKTVGSLRRNSSMRKQSLKPIRSGSGLLVSFTQIPSDLFHHGSNYPLCPPYHHPLLSLPLDYPQTPISRLPLLYMSSLKPLGSSTTSGRKSSSNQNTPSPLIITSPTTTTSAPCVSLLPLGLPLPSLMRSARLVKGVGSLLNITFRSTSRVC